MAWNKLDREKTPELTAVTAYVNNPLWEDLVAHLEKEYGAKHAFTYSGCVPTGWNVQWKKSGRALCRMYPMDGHFIALVVIGNREKAAFDLLLPKLTTYTKSLYQHTKDKNGLCWLMFEVREDTVLEDVKACIALR
ncbi:DUF3788 domain-containing protein [Eubacteriales bacterium OttesenSCG-928-M02]|nr:DUF3788 domain-containing protein [Eubacteriales bacterium OttesenSCG-928-M02]